MSYVTTDEIQKTRVIADAFFEVIPMRRADEIPPAVSHGKISFTSGRIHKFLRIPEFVPQNLDDAEVLYNFYLTMLRRGMAHCVNAELRDIALALPVLPNPSSTGTLHDALAVAFRAEETFCKERQKKTSSGEFISLDVIFAIAQKDFPNDPPSLFEAISFVDKNHSYWDEIRSHRRPRSEIRYSRIPDFRIPDFRIPDFRIPDFDLPRKTFSEMLFQLIRERGGDEVAIYTRAMIDRRLFSKIRSDKDYSPSKQTVLAFAIALNLDITEAENLLESAGFALSKSIRYDLAVRFFIENKIYDFNKINDVLFCYKFPLFGQSSHEETRYS